MSTRAVIRVETEGGKFVELYHHSDGYPSGVGAELVGLLREFDEGGAVGNYDADYFMARLMEKHPAHYFPTLFKHFDVAYFYRVTIRDDSEVKLSQGIGKWVVHCYEVSEWESDAPDYGFGTHFKEVKDFMQFVDAEIAKEKAEAERAKRAKRERPKSSEVRRAKMPVRAHGVKKA